MQVRSKIRSRLAVRKGSKHPGLRHMYSQRVLRVAKSAPRAGAKSKLQRLLWVQRHRCSKCGERIVRLSRLRACREVLKVVSDTVWWKTPCGEICEARFATVDHTHPSSKGGSNKFNNLTAMCARCNQKKGDKVPQKTKNWRRWKRDVCHTCGGKVWELRRKHCSDCRMRKRNSALLERAT